MLLPTPPIPGPPALMGDREDENRLWIPPVDDRVRKPIKQHSPTWEADRRACVGVLANERDGALDFGRERLAQTNHP